MECCYYLGSLKIHFCWDTEIMHRQWDARFQKSVLPIQKSVEVSLTLTDELPVPTEPFYNSKEMKVWNINEEEYRLYHPAGGAKPYLLSHRKGNVITIFALRSEKERIRRDFCLWYYIHIEQLLLENQALVLHSASILYRGGVIAFTAPSGTGKTTQTDLWHRCRENVSDLNGDRTLLQWTGGRWYGCGFPIAGSSVRCEQIAEPIKAIVIVRQAKQNNVRELRIIEKVTLLYSEITVLSMEKNTVNNAMELIENLASEIKIIQLDCTMEDNAVNVLHRYLYGE